MTSILIYLLGFCLVVAITMVIPGLNTLITPVWASFGKGIVLFAIWCWGWIVFCIKGIFASHFEIGRHLVLSDEDVDVRKSVED
ncbi:hypothetical protein [Pseudoalteromonas marina]|uniref:Uncharacterized protein n=1 Tax=Pseudoalteromonas marina TaxID=267375 RepID=A0ABT9FCC9_9GAMM|nr:hypothetical protein [Pseudoalteromonas marina]MDP2564393.1 hypothetical protein [Pseudoalteromonas marina]